MSDDVKNIEDVSNNVPVDSSPEVNNGDVVHAIGSAILAAVSTLNNGLDANRRSNKIDVYHSDEPSMTDQTFVEQSDINYIIQQYTLAGYRSEDFQNIAERVFSDSKRFVDCSQIPDMQTGFNMMQEASEAFIQNVPAKIREHFGHDPMAFYKHVASLTDASELKGLFGDLRNYSPPTAEQLEEGNIASVSTSKENKE
ncbi:minor capsid protein [Capybara microvirus Cap1_SP_140]|nr:minor capsid protein [Capybara microvirus Cap1_SP_140]